MSGNHKTPLRQRAEEKAQSIILEIQKLEAQDFSSSQSYAAGDIKAGPNTVMEQFISDTKAMCVKAVNSSSVNNTELRSMLVTIRTLQEKLATDPDMESYKKVLDHGMSELDSFMKLEKGDSIDAFLSYINQKNNPKIEALSAPFGEQVAQAEKEQLEKIIKLIDEKDTLVNSYTEAVNNHFIHGSEETLEKVNKIGQQIIDAISAQQKIAKPIGEAMVASLTAGINDRNEGLSHTQKRRLSH